MNQRLMAFWEYKDRLNALVKTMNINTQGRAETFRP